MLKLNDLDKMLKTMEKHDKLNEFIYIAFNYKIESNIKEYYVQHIEGDIILYIYEKKLTHNLFTLEFTTGNCDVYMDKSYYKNTFINTVYVNKCQELYNDNINDNIIIFTYAMQLKSKKEQKKVLEKIFSEDIINILYNEKA